MSVNYSRDGNIAVITICNPPVNSFSPTVGAGLQAAYSRFQSDDSVVAAVLCGDKHLFMAGADIAHLQNIMKGTASATALTGTGTQLLNELIEGGAKPTVAAIENLALGGGLELALACAGRVCTAGSRLGLPELSLGLIPGLGGTQRLPRLIGAAPAVQAMLTSKPFSAEQAVKLGLVDVVVKNPESLMTEAKNLALAIAAGKAPRVPALERNDRIGTVDAVRKVVESARKKLLASKISVPHPFACLEAVMTGAERGAAIGLPREGELFRKLLATDTAAALVHFFFAQRSCGRVPGVTDLGLKPRPIRTVGVVGGGLMGSGIATACALAGLKVIVKEISAKLVAKALATIRRNIESRARKGRLSEAKARAALSCVSGTESYADFASCDIVIEAAVERIDIKQRIFADLEAHTPKKCILATNTSTIDIDVVGARLADKTRVCGAHFFSPAHVMPLLEIVRTASTSPQVLVDLLAFGKRIRKTAVIVGNCVGFAVNRIFFPYSQAALLLVDAGVDPFVIDRALTKFGMPMGPFRLNDLVGTDINLHTQAIMGEAYPDRFYPSALRELMVQDGRLGEKSRGRGYYATDLKTRRATPDRDGIAPLLAKAREAASVPRAPQHLSEDEIVLAILLPVVNEALRVLEEGVSASAAQIDAMSVLSMGFPAHRGGVLFWAEQSLGSTEAVRNALSGFHQLFGHGVFRPSPALERLASLNLALSVPRNVPAADTGCDDDVCIVYARRTALARARRGAFRDTPVDDLLSGVLADLLRTTQIDPATVGDVTVGNVLRKGDTFATECRVAALLAGFPETVPVRVVNRLCSSGLQAIADVAAAVQTGQYAVGIAAGAESMSSSAFDWTKLPRNPRAKGTPAEDCYLTMLETSENVADRCHVTRQSQDAFAAESHRRAIAARDSGAFAREIVPLAARTRDRKSGAWSEPVVVDKDEGPRPGTVPAKLARLRPVLGPQCCTTAGNASQLTDGAAAVLVMKRSTARSLGLGVLGVLRSYAVVGLEPAVMGLGPLVAIPRAVERAGLTLDDIDVYEVNEAFASQALYCVDALGIPRDRVNMRGGAIALGHPLGCTGARMTATLLSLMQDKHARFGVVSMCIGTGMGAAAVFERTAYP